VRNKKEDEECERVPGGQGRLLRLGVLAIGPKKLDRALVAGVEAQATKYEGRSRISICRGE
jgi:hypothetical protein